MVITFVSLNAVLIKDLRAILLTLCCKYNKMEETEIWVDVFDKSFSKIFDKNTSITDTRSEILQLLQLLLAFITLFAFLRSIISFQCHCSMKVVSQLTDIIDKTLLNFDYSVSRS